MARVPDWAVGLIPVGLTDRYRRWRFGRTWFDPRGRSVRRVFAEIYRRNLWGGPAGEMYSGPGSDPAVADPYVRAVADFIRANAVRSVTDVGCGDFRVGGALVAATGVRYHGVDVVDEVIDRHRRECGSPAVAFSRLDATTDALPDAELGLVRQVLQHLSNAQIAAVLRNCRRFRHLLVTEHVLPDDRATEPNRDIRHGVETRVDVGSYVRLDRPPFDVPVLGVVCEVLLPDGSLVRTVRVGTG